MDLNYWVKGVMGDWQLAWHGMAWHREGKGREGKGKAKEKEVKFAFAMSLWLSPISPNSSFFPFSFFFLPFISLAHFSTRSEVA